MPPQTAPEIGDDQDELPVVSSLGPTGLGTSCGTLRSGFIKRPSMPDRMNTIRAYALRFAFGPDRCGWIPWLTFIAVGDSLQTCGLRIGLSGLKVELFFSRY